jgi:hypothetical protein
MFEEFVRFEEERWFLAVVEKVEFGGMAEVGLCGGEDRLDGQKIVSTIGVSCIGKNQVQSERTRGNRAAIQARDNAEGNIWAAAIPRAELGVDGVREEIIGITFERGGGEIVVGVQEGGVVDQTRDSLGLGVGSDVRPPGIVPGRRNGECLIADSEGIGEFKFVDDALLLFRRRESHVR